jgi:hypothetical protein
MSALERVFEEVDIATVDWRQLFAVSRRSYGGISIWQERTPSARFTTQGLETIYLSSVCQRMWAGLTPYIAASADPTLDAVLCSSLYKSRALHVPPSLARYAALFYLSSVVRYRPELLDPHDFGKESWLSDRVPIETALPLLVDAVSGIEARRYVFGSAAGVERA